MAQPRLKAKFFADTKGNVVTKAKPIKESFRTTFLSSFKMSCSLCGVIVSRHIKRSFLNEIPCAHIDHVLPRSRGGQNEISNLRILCERCNLSKGAK
jgi:hypothetical protein